MHACARVQELNFSYVGDSSGMVSAESAEGTGEDLFLAVFEVGGSGGIINDSSFNLYCNQLCKVGLSLLVSGNVYGD